MTQKHLTDQRFIDLDLPPALTQGIKGANFEFLTPIQARALPYLLKQRDVAGQAQTGTGKTAAFLIATFARLDRTNAKAKPSDLRALILAPTRELAIQIFKDAQVIGRYLPYRLTLAYGGTGYNKQRRELESGADVLIGTPGRVIDYFKQKVFSLSSIEVVVLDEADRMFDLGFIRDIRFLLRRMPKPERRLNMLFSATLSLRVNELAYEHMNNPQTVKVESQFATVDAVQERIYFPANDEKIPLLIGLLQKFDPTRTLIFSNTKQTAESLGAWLVGNGFSAGVLSGDVPQKEREHLLRKFKQGELALLVATDVAARGLHIANVSHVINFDLPQDPEDYVHRVGRTARAGADGDAMSFACETHAFSLADIEQYIGHRIPVASFDASDLAQPQPPHRVESKRNRGPRHNQPKKKPSERFGQQSSSRSSKINRHKAGNGRNDVAGHHSIKQSKVGNNDMPKGNATRVDSTESDSTQPTRVRRRETPAVG